MLLSTGKFWIRKTKIESSHKVEISKFLNANNYKWISIDEVKNQLNRNVKLEKLSNFSFSKILKVDLIWFKISWVDQIEKSSSLISIMNDEKYSQL